MKIRVTISQIILEGVEVEVNGADGLAGLFQQPPEDIHIQTLPFRFKPSREAKAEKQDKATDASQLSEEVLVTGNAAKGAATVELPQPEADTAVRLYVAGRETPAADASPIRHPNQKSLAYGEATIPRKTSAKADIGPVVKDGRKPPTKREQIIALVASKDMTREQLYDAILDADLAISRDSAYQTVRTLLQRDLIREVRISDDDERERVVIRPGSKGGES